MGSTRRCGPPGPGCTPGASRSSRSRTWTPRSTEVASWPSRRRCRSRSGPSARAEHVQPGTEVERVFREAYGRAVATLVGLLGDIDAAEEAVQDAFTTALARWPADGVPPSPAGWIVTTARNRAIDRLRRESTRAARQAQAVVQSSAPTEPTEEGPVRDDRLR